VHDHIESCPPHAQRRVLDAVVERQAADVHPVDVVAAQPVGEVGLADLVEPERLAVDPGIDDAVDQLVGEVDAQLGAGRLLDAMDRPGATLLVEGVMIGRMPIARRNHHIELLREPIERLDNLVAPVDGQRAPGTEVVLDVDDDERFGHLHQRS
jgi:hypothetical protein